MKRGTNFISRLFKSRKSNPIQEKEIEKKLKKKEVKKPFVKGRRQWRMKPNGKRAGHDLYASCGVRSRNTGAIYSPKRTKVKGWMRNDKGKVVR